MSKYRRARALPRTKHTFPGAHAFVAACVAGGVAARNCSEVRRAGSGLTALHRVASRRADRATESAAALASAASVVLHSMASAACAAASATAASASSTDMSAFGGTRRSKSSTPRRPVNRLAAPALLRVAPDARSIASRGKHADTTTARRSRRRPGRRASAPVPARRARTGSGTAEPLRALRPGWWSRSARTGSQRTAPSRRRRAPGPGARVVRAPSRVARRVARRVQRRVPVAPQTENVSVPRLRRRSRRGPSRRSVRLGGHLDVPSRVRRRRATGSSLTSPEYPVAGTSAGVCGDAEMDRAGARPRTRGSAGRRPATPSGSSSSARPNTPHASACHPSTRGAERVVLLPAALDGRARWRRRATRAPRGPREASRARAPRYPARVPSRPPAAVSSPKPPPPPRRPSRRPPRASRAPPGSGPARTACPRPRRLPECDTRGRSRPARSGGGAGTRRGRRRRAPTR